MNVYLKRLVLVIVSGLLGTTFMDSDFCLSALFYILTFLFLIGFIAGEEPIVPTGAELWLAMILLGIPLAVGVMWLGQSGILDSCTR